MPSCLIKKESIHSSGPRSWDRVNGGCLTKMLAYAVLCVLFQQDDSGNNERGQTGFRCTSNIDMQRSHVAAIVILECSNKRSHAWWRSFRGWFHRDTFVLSTCEMNRKAKNDLPYFD